MVVSSPGEILLQAVSGLQDVTRNASFPLASPSAGAAERDRRELLGQLEDYLLPRLRRLDAPCSRWSAGPPARASRH